MFKTHDTPGVVFGLRPGLLTGIAVLTRADCWVTPQRPAGYQLRGWAITNLTRQYLREWVTAVAQTDVPVMVAIDRPALPSQHADALLASVEGLGVPVQLWPGGQVDTWLTADEHRAHYFDATVRNRPVVALAANAALFTAVHSWNWPDPAVTSQDSIVT